MGGVKDLGLWIGNTGKGAEALKIWQLKEKAAVGQHISWKFQNEHFDKAQSHQHLVKYTVGKWIPVDKPQSVNLLMAGE